MTTWNEAVGNCKLYEDILYLPKSDSDFMDLTDKMREAEITSTWIGVKAVWKLKWSNGSIFGTYLFIIVSIMFQIARFILKFLNKFV